MGWTCNVGHTNLSNGWSCPQCSDLLREQVASAREEIKKLREQRDKSYKWGLADGRKEGDHGLARCAHAHAWLPGGVVCPFCERDSLRAQLDKAMRALANIRDATILWQRGDETKKLRDVHNLSKAALGEGEK